MACMTHDCGSCGHVWHDNQARPACPKCGSPFVHHEWDEEPDRDQDHDEEPEAA